MAYKFNPFTGNFDDFNGPNGEFISIDVNGNFSVDSTGRARVPLGTAALPSIYPDTDTNTGIYSPGADQVAVATNGTGRLFIDANGNVGVGTSSPNIGNFSRALTINRVSGNSSGLEFSTAGTVEGSVFTRDDANQSLQISRVGNFPITFFTNATERVRITGAGLVGVGTSAPVGKLAVGNSSNNFLVSIDSSASYAEIQAYNAPLYINRQGNNTILNLGGGSVGIGTSSPARTLDVRGSAVFNDGTVQATIWPQIATNIAGFGTNNNFPVSVVTNGIQRLHVTSAGNVGIGTTSPGSALEINAAAATSPFIAKINTAEAARIDSSGRLLVGTSTSVNTGTILGAQVQVATDAVPLALRRNSNSASGPTIHLGKTRSTTDGSFTIVQSGDTLGTLQFSGADGVDLETPGAAILAQVDGTPDANDMPGRLVFSTTADGAATPTERMRITSAGVLQIADAGNITVGTTTGTKIGTATTQKLGFYNATPVVQPTAVANATDAATVITQLNDLLAKLRTLGIIAT